LAKGLGRSRGHLDGRLAGQDEEGQELLEVQLDAVRIVREVADREILAEVELVVTSPDRKQERPVDSRRPNDLTFSPQDPDDVLEDRVAVVGTFGNGRESISAEQQAIRATHAS